MVQSMMLRNVAPQLYISALQSAWSTRLQIYDPSIWLHRDASVDEKMMRDADIAAAVNYRTQLVAGQSWVIQPRHEDSPRAKLVTMVATELLDSIRHFSTARRMLAMSFLSGARYAEIQGEHRTLKIGDGKPRVWWVPTNLRDMDKRRVRLVRVDDGNKGIRPPDAYPEGYDPRTYSRGTARHARTAWEYWSVTRAEWVRISDEGSMRMVRNVYMDDESSLGHGRGLRDSLGWWWYAKEHVFAESLDAVERFAQGILVAKVDGIRDGSKGAPNSEVIRQWTRVLEDMRSRKVLVFDKEDEVEHVQMNAAGWELLRTIREELRQTIRSLILGGTLNTGGTEADEGSYARAKVHEDATAALVSFDREVLQESLTDDLLQCIWSKNWANLVDLGIHGEPMPEFVIEDETQEEPKERAEVASTLVGMGLPLAKADLYDKTGFRKPDPGEEVVEGGGQPMGGVPGDPAQPFPGSPESGGEYGGVAMSQRDAEGSEGGAVPPGRDAKGRFLSPTGKVRPARDLAARLDRIGDLCRPGLSVAKSVLGSTEFDAEYAAALEFCDGRD